MKVELERVGPGGRRARLGTLLGVLGPLATLGIVVAAAVAPNLMAPGGGPATWLPTSPGATAAPSPESRAAADTLIQLGIPRFAYGLPVRAVDELLAERRAGTVRTGLVAVARNLSMEAPDTACSRSGAGMPAAFCHRISTLTPAAVGTPAGSNPNRSVPVYPRILPGTPLPGVFAGDPDARLQDSPQVLSLVIGRFVRTRQSMCSLPYACGDEFILERVAWAAGGWTDRILVRGPGITQAVAGTLGPRSQAIASRETDRQEQILSIAILQAGGLAPIDPEAARAADAAAAVAGIPDGPVWYLRSMTGPRTGQEAQVTWAVIHHETGRILADGTVSGA